jgi:hypothetical protein
VKLLNFATPDPAGGMVRDAADDPAQIRLGIEAIELRGFDQRVHQRGALAASVGAGEGPVVAAHSNRTPLAKHQVYACSRIRRRAEGDGN